MLANTSRRKQSALRSNKGTSVIIATVILSATVLTLGFVVLYWAQIESSRINSEYARNVSEGIELLNEKILLIHTHYDNATKELGIFLMNYGVDGYITMDRAILKNDTWTESFDVELRSLDGIPISSLGSKQEGYFTLYDLSLTENSLYTLQIQTRRGGLFFQNIGI